jgi:hypothetical protein
MEPNNNSIITEDGQRLTIKDGRITGTEDPGPGLAYETGNVLDENSGLDNEKGKTCPANERSDDSNGKE